MVSRHIKILPFSRYIHISKARRERVLESSEQPERFFNQAVYFFIDACKSSSVKLLAFRKSGVIILSGHLEPSTHIYPSACSLSPTSSDRTDVPFPPIRNTFNQRRDRHHRSGTSLLLSVHIPKPSLRYSSSIREARHSVISAHLYSIVVRPAVQAGASLSRNKLFSQT